MIYTHSHVNFCRLKIIVGYLGVDAVVHLVETFIYLRHYLQIPCSVQADEYLVLHLSVTEFRARRDKRYSSPEGRRLLWDPSNPLTGTEFFNRLHDVDYRPKLRMCGAIPPIPSVPS
jgi:hypothetical protein